MSQSINSDGSIMQFKSTLEIVAEAISNHLYEDIQDCERLAIAAIEAMRVLVKNDPKGCQADDEILQNYINAALK